MEQMWNSILNDANTQWVLLSTLLLGTASGVLGSFALLRKQSLIGDAVAHAALPGICIAFLLVGEKDFIVLLAGAATTGLLAAYCIQFISSYSRIKEDTAIGLVLSVFFGAGIMLLTKVAQSPSGNKSGLDSFIFGQAASLVGTDVKIMAFTALILIGVTFLLFKEFKVSTFDPQFAKGIGLPTPLLNLLFISLLVLTVVIGIQAVGVIMMAALLITPSIAARYWTDSLGIMVVVSGLIGAISGVSGTLISTLGKGLSTGPFIVLSATMIFLFSLLFAPERGLVSKWLKRIKNDQIINEKSLLLKFEQSNQFGISKEQVLHSSSISVGKALRYLKGFEQRGWLLNQKGIYRLTTDGEEVIKQTILLNHMVELREMYPNELADVSFPAFEDGKIEKMNNEEAQTLHQKMLDLQQRYKIQPVVDMKRGG
ncbi:metal ABC transporter permease [Bacillus sp. 2205SS5-2]|uniref:metal ABC transporter permease n=1 Tax=Bacillus sp. 2205SS5-2 TaxID=3109031 RepID=UPI0030052414